MLKSIYNQNIVYLFTNYKGQKYIGSKTNCIVENNKILQKGNKPYFTSSTNKEFKQSLETHEYKLEILFTTLDKTINIVEKERYYQCVGGAGRGVNKRKMTCYDLKKNKFVRIDTDVYLKNKNTRYLSPTSSAYKKLFSIC